MKHRLGDAVRHPWWAVDRVMRAAAGRFSRSAGGTILAAFRRASRGRIELRNRPMEREPDTDEAIRWLGPVASGSRRQHALFAHPESTVRYRFDAPPAGRIEAWATLLPAVWDRGAAAVLFEVAARRPRSGAASSTRRTLDPARTWTDRRWVRLSVTLPAAADAEDTAIEIVLRTRTPRGGHSTFAWAAWGDPAVEWTLERGRARAAAVSFLRRVRDAGLRDTVRRLRESRGEHHRDLFAAWIQQHTPTRDALDAMRRTQEEWRHRPLISVITPVYNTPPVLLRACVESVKAQAYPNWQLCLADDASTRDDTRTALAALAAGDPRINVTRLPENRGISDASNVALASARGDFVVLLDHDDVLAPEALFALVRLLNDEPDADIVYSDYDKLEPDGSRSEPYFKPDWSPELLFSYMYLCHMSAARRALVIDVGGFRREYNGAQDYDLFLRLTERTDRIRHIPAILYHWRKAPGSTAAAPQAKTWALDAGRRALEDAVRRRGWEAEVLPGKGPGFYRVRRRVSGSPLVSILILTRGGGRGADGRDILAECLSALARRTTYSNYEMVIASDSGAVSPAAVEAIATARHRILDYQSPAPFNFSRKMNFAAAHAAGEHFVLFNDDVEVITPDWIEALLEYSQQPEIGAVGGKLYFPDGRLQHAGMLLGVAGVAAHAFYQHPGTTPGYFGSTIVTGNMSAVTAALMMTRRANYERCGGFNEALPIDFNDVDYCLKLRAAGLRVVFTPWAEGYHHESASFGPRTQDPDRLAEMRRIWGAEIDRDPYLNVNLSREFPDYRIRL